MDTPTILVNKKLRDGRLKTDGIKVARSTLPCATSYLSGKKIDDTNEIPIMEKVGIEVGQKIQQARLDKKLKQTDVANLLNMPVNTYQTFENGSAVRNNSTLHIIGKKLGIKLTGS
jgi:putative transcription factor